MIEWQPIETAPKSGKAILIWQPDRPFGRAYVAEWDAEWTGGWWIVHDGKSYDRPLRGPDPSHWMLLPAPPTGGE